jgi:hypothetical protein
MVLVIECGGGRQSYNIIQHRKGWRMEDPRPTLIVNATVEITAQALEAIVENAKQIAGCDERGRYQVDTADKVGEMITRFLFEKDFEAYVQNMENYPR